MKLLQKTIALILIGLLVIGQAAPVVAQEAPTPPSAPTAPTPPAGGSTAPDAPTAPSAPTAPDAPRPEDSDDSEDEEEAPEEEPDEEEAPEEVQNEATPAVSTTADGQQTGSQTAGGQMGDTSIDTGDANNSAGISVAANTNTSLSGVPAVEGDSAPSIGIVNSDNGTGSSNTGSATLDNGSETIQNNSATVTNSLNQTSISGQNWASDNVGSSSVKTGDANVSGTIISSVNTNIDGVGVAEFNVVDDYIGDIVLDFGSSCFINCTFDGSVQNVNNGSSSTNTGTIDHIANDATFQTNDASVDNYLTLAADSGNNAGDNNTGGDTSIDTGDANVSANVLTFANNNVSGGVYYGVVNIYGDLIGDIIFPEELLTGCCAGDLLASNIANGSDSTNTANINQNTQDATFQTNDAVIDNLLILDANTGENSASGNTNGDSSIDTGNTNIDANVFNIANNNVAGGAWWIVLINDAGNWIGKIMGAGPGATMAGSTGTEFIVDPTGEISITNAENGTGSTNTGAVNQTTNTTTVQDNDARVVNTLNLSANTGRNSTNDNTNGNNEIDTGDASIVANVFNFVNNNISGAGKLFITVVNIFPTAHWFGDFVSPGHEQEEELVATSSDNTNEHAIGGADINTADQANQGNQTHATNTQATATPTPSPKPSQTQLAIAGGSTGTGTGGNSFVLGSTEDTLIAPQKQDNIITINLAWLLLALPCAIFFIIRRPHFSLPLKRIASALNSLL